MTLKNWKKLSQEEAEQMLLEMLDDPTFFERITFEASKNRAGNRTKIRPITSEEHCIEEMEYCRNSDRINGSVNDEETLKSVVISALKENVKDISKWIKSMAYIKQIRYTADKDIAFYYVWQNGEIVRNTTNEIRLTFFPDHGKISDVGFLLLRVRIRGEDN